MKNIISLDGAWEAAGLNVGFGDWSLPESLTPSDAVRMDAQVPGKIRSDEDRQWWFKKTFEVDEDFKKRRTYLELDGVSAPAAVFINGDETGTCADGTSSCRLDVGEHINIGRNTIAVRFDPASMIGIMRSANLVSYDAVSISDVHVDAEIEGGYANAWITIEVENYTREDQNVVASIVVELDDNREKIEVLDTVSPFGGIIEAVIRIEEPSLWWPNGFGEQTLYSCMIGMQVEGEVMDVSETKFGVRDIKLIEQDESGEQRFTFLMNGMDIFCKGANWVPDLGIDGCRDRVKLAADANFNMLRVSGGDGYDRPEFYQACDEMGIMLWHDLSPVGIDQSNEDSRRLAFARVRSAVKRIRAHSSVIAWSGEGVSEILQSLDHYRLYVPVPAFPDNQIDIYPQDFAALHSEVNKTPSPIELDLGVRGMPSEEIVRKWMGDWSTDEQFAAFAGILQGEVIKAQIEHARQDKWTTSGAILKDFLDDDGSGLVESDGRPKPAYYYAKHAFALVTVSFRESDGKLLVYLSSDDRTNDLSGRLGVGVFSFDSNALDLNSVSVTLIANSTRAVLETQPIDELITDPARQCLVALFEVKGQIAAQAVHFARPLGEIEFPQPRLLVGREQIDDTHHKMDLAANAYARNVAISNIPPKARPSDNYFDMLPGEHYQVIIDNITEEQAKQLVINVWRR